MELVSFSTAPMVMDALPALTARFYRGKPALYTQARMYVSPRGLHVGLWVFQRQPQPDTRAYFAAAGDKGMACVAMSATAAFLHALPLSPALFPGGDGAKPPDDVRFFSGEDEQGWYWGGQCVIPDDAMAAAGIECAPGSRFSAAVFVSQDCMAGASCLLGREDTPMDPAHFQPFGVVSF